MSTHVATAPAALPSETSSSCACAGKALAVGFVGIVLTLLGFFVSDGHAVAISWLVGVTFWTAIAIGMLMLVMIHHILDASWSVVLRRQFEHGLAAFPWLALLFAPLVIDQLVIPGMIWNTPPSARPRPVARPSSSAFSA